MNKRKLGILTLLVLYGALSSLAVAEEAMDAPRVTASTSWVAAIAQAAGAQVTAVLAPAEMRHPAEYDFRPSDIVQALNSDFVVWAGYEPFIKNLMKAADIPQETVLTVYTSNQPEVLSGAVADLAEALGTQAHYLTWKEELDVTTEKLQAGASTKKTGAITAAVNIHLAGLARWLGYDVVAEFGRGELTPGALQEIIAKEPQVIIDNWHMPMGEALAGQGREYIQLINFPGREETQTLIDVLEYNGRVLGLISR